MKIGLLTCIALALFGQVATDSGAQARRAFDQLFAGDYSTLYASFSPQMQAAVTEGALWEKLGGQLQALGKPVRVAEPVVQKAPGADIVVINASFATASFDFQFSVMPDGKIGGLFLRPVQPLAAAWAAPEYSRAGSFNSREITLGAAEWKLPGTLTYPTDKKPAPAVVLVHGSGPNDRDESVGGSKLFRDLAEGLSSRGIVVLRYDKRTKVHGQRMTGANITLQDETVDDAVAAVAFLGSQPEVNGRKIFLLGHSLGGYVAPRIGARAEALAGLVVMAGATGHLEDAIVEQSEYLGVPQASLEKLRADSQRVKRIQPGAEAVFNAPASYWLDLKGYDPPREAAKLKMPMLILQGERDYQATMKDFAGWKTALGARTDVTFHSYSALNHLFVAGEGKSLPAEDQKPGHAPAQVIDDIANWILAR